MPDDYYDVLGIPRTASAEEVRRAYRQLAKQHHPDVNHDDPEADSRFKAVNEAYEVLRDPRQRAAYDRFGHAGVRGSRASSGPVPGDFTDLGDLFEQVFGFGTRRQARSASPTERGADLRARVRLSFAEAAFGVTRTLNAVRRETCAECEGTGAARGTKPETCPTCQGSGEVRRVSQSFFGSLVNVHPCGECGGAGRIVRTPCTDCRGSGRAQRSRTLDVEIPAGIANGMQIRLSGEGDHGRFGGPPGDMYVDVEVAAHEHFQRDGDDVTLELRVNSADAALGSEITVPTIEGTTTLRMPAGTQTGDTFRLSGLGIPHLRRAGRGDQVVTVFVATPPRLTQEQRELFERLRSTLPTPEVVPQAKPGFWDRVRERFS